MKYLSSLIFFISFSHQLLANDHLMQKLSKLGAKCNQNAEQVNICIFDKNKFDYPNKTAFIFDKQTSSKNLLFHLHGHSFGPLSTGEDFDSSLRTMIKSFNFDKSVGRHPSFVMIIPFTTGKCIDYDFHFSNYQNFESYLTTIRDIIEPLAKIHLSAHSGGGRTLAKTINKIKLKVSSISLFDAIYNPNRTHQYKSWIKLPNKVLNLIAVAPVGIKKNFNHRKGLTPFNESRKITNSFNWNIKAFKEVKSIHSSFYELIKVEGDSKINFLYDSKSQKYNHWLIVKKSFDYVLKSLEDPH